MGADLAAAGRYRAGLGLKGFIAAALGGFSTAYGPIVGGLMLGLAEGFSAGFISSAYQDAFTFGLLLLVLLLRPQGLLGILPRAAADDEQEEVLSADVFGDAFHPRRSVCGSSSARRARRCWARF